MKRSRKYLRAALVVAVVLVGLSFASAAGLSLSGGKLSSAVASHPCPGTATAVQATPWTYWGHTRYRAVTLTLPSGCENSPVQVRVTSGTDVRSGSGNTNTSGQVTISFGTSNTDANTYALTSDLTIKATVSGWDLPTTATMPAIWCTVVSGGVAGATCTAAVTLRYDNWRAAWYYDVVVQTTSATWLVWEVGFNLNHTFYGTVPTLLGNSILDEYRDGDVTWDTTQDHSGWWAINDVARTSACAALPGELLVRGENNGPTDDLFQQLSHDRERRFGLVVNISQAGYFDVISPGCT